jgi:DNA-binding LacI/PurR family transcriptional regulator
MSRSDKILVIVPDIANPFFPLVIQGIEDAAQRVGFSRHLDPPLTTITQPMREIGENTVRLLLNIVHGDTRETRLAHIAPSTHGSRLDGPLRAPGPD